MASRFYHDTIRFNRSTKIQIKHRNPTQARSKIFCVAKNVSVGAFDSPRVCMLTRAVSISLRMRRKIMLVCWMILDTIGLAYNTYIAYNHHLSRPKESEQTTKKLLRKYVPHAIDIWNFLFKAEWEAHTCRRWRDKNSTQQHKFPHKKNQRTWRMLLRTNRISKTMSWRTWAPFPKTKSTKTTTPLNWKLRLAQYEGDMKPERPHCPHSCHINNQRCHTIAITPFNLWSSINCQMLFS